LVDAYADLVAGEFGSEALRAAAEAAGLYREGQLRSAVVTEALLAPYADTVLAIADATAAYHASQLDTLMALLSKTTAGRQGARPANLLLHLWRYLRRLTAAALYANGFLRDDVPQVGTLTVFYGNDVELLRDLLG
jgi:hypothetical protein